MNEKEFLREKEQLQCVIQKMDNEEKVLEDRLVKTNQSYEKESYVKAHLLYLNNKKLADLRKIKDKPYFARVDFTAKGEEKEKLYIGKLSLMDS